MIKRYWFVALLLTAASAHARPLFLEPSPTSGLLAFETVFSLTQRWDQYGTPESEYESFSFPVTFRLGVHRRLDIGFSIQYVSHHIEVGDLRFGGNDSGRISPEFKLGLLENLSFQGIWHLSSSENEDNELPVGRPSNLEGRLLATIPTAFPISIDAGYLSQRQYNGRLGVLGSDQKEIDPGDIADFRLAVIVPISKKFSASAEGIYSYIGDRKVDGETITDSSGEALDVGVGLSWEYKDITLGLGVAAGLLEETHTSFAIDRGAGDITGKFLFSYKLKPRKREEL